jgi:hypothetical protein
MNAGGCAASSRSICRTGGTLFSQPMSDIAGPSHPFTREELHEKFVECGSLVLPPQRLDSVFAQVETLETLGSVRELVERMSVEHPSHATTVSV